MKINEPDFRTWADTLTLMTRKEIETALEQAFNQGYHLGLNQGWAIEQDKEHKLSSFKWNTGAR